MKKVTIVMCLAIGFALGIPFCHAENAYKPPKHSREELYQDILVSLLMPYIDASNDEGREQLLEGALINRYLELIGGTLQKQFGCEKVVQIKRLGDPRIPFFEVSIQVVTYEKEYGKPPYDLVTLTIRDRVDMFYLAGIEKKRNISPEEYKNLCSWFKR